MSLRFLQPFYEKINDSYLKLAVRKNDSAWYSLHCKLCDNKITNNWVDHELSGVHCAAVNHIAEQLINVFFSPGITFRAKLKDGFCVFCSQPLTNFSDFLIHLSNFHHQEKVEAFKTRLGSGSPEVRPVSANDRENNLLKEMIIHNRIRFDGEYIECVLCNFKMPQEEQFCVHILRKDHLTRVLIDQLCIAAAMMQVHKGISFKNGSFFCMVCGTVIGNGLAAADQISVHISLCNGDFDDEYLSLDSFFSANYGSCES